MLGIYTRISGKKVDGKDTSIEIQTIEGIKVAIKLGMNYKIYTDKGISGTKDEIEERPAFAEMLKDIDKEILTAVYVIDQSRLERNTNIWQMFQFLVNKKDIKYYPNGVLTDLTDPNIKFATGILSLTNQLFAEQTRKKVNETFDLRASKGLTHGVLPYGYKKGIDKKYEIDEIEAVNVRRMFELSLSGIGTYTIANILNGEGIPTKHKNINGKPSHIRYDKYTREATTFERKNIIWRGTVIYDMLKNTVYKGIRVWNKKPKGNKVTIEVDVPAIIDVETFDKVNRNLINNKQKAGKRSEFNYLLNGLVFCGNCGLEYRGKKRLVTKDSAYKCKAVGKCADSRGISIIRFENFIIQHLFLSKDLKNLLLSLPVNTEQSVVLKNKLIQVEGDLVTKIKLRDKLLNILTDVELEDDVAINDKYKQAKRDIEILSNNIDILKVQILEADNQFAKMKVENAINEFKLTTNFEDTKRLVHSLIERITVTHKKLDRGGIFFVTIKYKGFEETSTFTTDWFTLKWNWIYYSRTTATNEQQRIEDIQERKDYFDFRGIEYTDADFEDLTFDGQESISAMQNEIILDNDNLISFN
ncbi:recombinase family protein [Flavobacterium sp.]|uniref:recombinase family protein n=1 Tax=Flavobacterium sp. TaxID=239 RepID=UPI00374FE324